MRTIAYAVLALVITAGAAVAQSGTDAGGPLGEAGRRGGFDAQQAYGVKQGRARMVRGSRSAPRMVRGARMDGKGTYAGGYRGEAARRRGVRR